jgi:hypothetical protein
LMLPSQVSQPHCQGQRQHNQNKFPRPVPRFVVFQQVFEAARTRCLVRIDAQGRPPPRRRCRLIQSKKRRSANHGSGIVHRRSRRRRRFRRWWRRSRRHGFGGVPGSLSLTLTFPRGRSSSRGSLQQGRPAHPAEAVCIRILIAAARTAHNPSPNLSL